MFFMNIYDYIVRFCMCLPPLWQQKA